MKLLLQSMNLSKDQIDSLLQAWNNNSNSGRLAINSSFRADDDRTPDQITPKEFAGLLQQL